MSPSDLPHTNKSIKENHGYLNRSPTVIFCNRYIPRNSRTHDQMTQAARSGMQNIAEGNKQQSLAGYLMITLINQVNFLLDKLITSLKEKHTKDGKFTEQLYRKRMEYRRNG